MARSTTPAVELPVGERIVRVSNPDRVYFPERGWTKLDLVEYYLGVGDGIVRALRDRPTTLERWPSGVHEGIKMATRTDPRGDAFYQKRVPQGAPDYVRTARIAFPSGRTADEVAPSELAVVAWAANLGTITFHPWPVRAADVERPDQLRIDLDPSPAPTSPTRPGWPPRCGPCCVSWGWRAGRRRPAGAAYTSSCRSCRSGRSPRYGAR
jgi:DNA primase